MLARQVAAPVRLDEGLRRALAVPRPGAWVRAAAVDWAIIAGTFALVGWVDHPVGYALALVPLGSRQQALGALFHDAAHRLVARPRWLNDALGSLLSAWPLGLSLGGYRRYHFAHHRHLGTDGDPEITHKRALPQWALPASPRRVARHFALDLLGGGLPHLAAAGRLTRPVSALEAGGLGAFWAAITLIAWRFHMIWVPVLWVTSIATVFWSGVRLRIWTEHLGTLDTHRIAVPAWLAHLIMPHSIGLHWEHHHWPGVPFSSLPRLRAALPPGEGAPPVIGLGELVGAFVQAGRLESGGLPGARPVARAARLASVIPYVGHVAAPMALGVLVYALCRPVLPRALGWLPVKGLLAGRLPAVVVDVAPDALWAYALTALVALVWRGESGGARRLWLGATVLVVAGWELGQRWGLVPGRFDALDLVFSVAACGLAMLLCPEDLPGDNDHAP